MSFHNPNECNMSFSNQLPAGTYVKEFVHGDFNRTKPSLKTLLGVDTDILALDVMEVQLPWPRE